MVVITLGDGVEWWGAHMVRYRCVTRTHPVRSKPESSDPLLDGRPPTLGPSRDQAVASSLALLWKLCFGPRLPAFVCDPGMLQREGRMCVREGICVREGQGKRGRMYKVVH